MTSYSRLRMFASNGYIRWCRTLLQDQIRSERTPSIHFPVRRKANGEPLVSLSLDNYNTTAQEQKGNKYSIPSQGDYFSLPVGYGRKAISQEEIEAINMGFARH